MKISILMLTHNAPKYVLESILTLQKTAQVDYELIVVDNKSNLLTKIILKILKMKKYINVLKFNKDNELFAKGNNTASKLASSNSSHYLLLNSDVKINDKLWLKKLYDIHPKDGGISALGYVNIPPFRADGYCFLIDKDLYDQYKLDENFEWWWAVTKLESEILKLNKKVIAVDNHEKLIHHYGGRSGKGYQNAKGMDIEINEVISWFENNSVTYIDSLE